MISVGSVNFNGAASGAVKEINPREWAQHLTKEKEVKAELLKQMPKSIQLLDKMKNFVGEVPNIIINAVGTGLVAPIFIKHNPLSKADDDTKTYSAWRQPVSAVLAVATQASLVAPFNNLLNNMTNKGEFVFRPEVYNKTAYQDVDFHEKMIKKEKPNLTKIEINKLAKEAQYKQLEGILESLYHDSTIHYISNGEKVPLSPEKVKDVLTQTAEDMLKKPKYPGDKELAQELLVNIKASDKPNIKTITKGLTEKQTGKFVYDVAQKYISHMSSNVKGMKQATGLIVSLAILPVTCILLNKLYPKFMDLAFPNLSKKKDDNHQDKAQDTFTKAVDAAVTPRYKVENKVGGGELC